VADPAGRSSIKNVTESQSMKPAPPKLLCPDKYGRVEAPIQQAKWSAKRLF
jgi:hypothetical protein